VKKVRTEERLLCSCQASKGEPSRRAHHHSTREDSRVEADPYPRRAAGPRGAGARRGAEHSRADLLGVLQARPRRPRHLRGATLAAPGRGRHAAVAPVRDPSRSLPTVRRHRRAGAVGGAAVLVHLRLRAARRLPRAASGQDDHQRHNAHRVQMRPRHSRSTRRTSGRSASVSMRTSSGAIPPTPRPIARCCSPRRRSLTS